MSKDNSTKTAQVTVFNCLGCQSTLETISYADKVSLDICSNCHPFYTGKQKLIDTAGRVDRFKSMQKKANIAKEELNKRVSISKTKDQSQDENKAKDEDKAKDEAVSSSKTV